MHLFGDRNEPHLVHFEAQRERGSVVLAWDVRNAPALSWRVLRSERDFAETAAALPGSGQTIVTEGADTRVTDDRLAEGTTYYYSVFAQDERGAWHLQVKTKLASHDHQRWRRGEGVIGQAWLAADVLDMALRDNPRRM